MSQDEMIKQLERRIEELEAKQSQGTYLNAIRPWYEISKYLDEKIQSLPQVKGKERKIENNVRIAITTVIRCALELKRIQDISSEQVQQAYLIADKIIDIFLANDTAVATK